MEGRLGGFSLTLTLTLSLLEGCVEGLVFCRSRGTLRCLLRSLRRRGGVCRRRLLLLLGLGIGFGERGLS